MSAALTELAEWSDYSNLDEDVEEKNKKILLISERIVQALLINYIYMKKEKILNIQKVH